MDRRSANLAEAADSLALAVIASSSTPVLLLDDRLHVVAASESFCDTYQFGRDGLGGRALPDLGEGEWALPQLASLLRATAAGSGQIDAYEMDLMRKEGSARRLIVNARRLDYFDADNVRLLMSVTDVTDRRVNEALKDSLLRDKEILLRELQHRVANSLQIIASVLMQSARRVRSERARSHLRDAGNRVMSIAALQRLLSESTIGEVQLSTYFRELCGTIAASMIDDPNRIELAVEVDGSKAGADDSVRLGLIVTELVINALKHGLAGNRKGRVEVGYRTSPAGWALTVRDTGAGLPVDRAGMKPGLGTGIIDALAGQLGAEVTVENAYPGVLATIGQIE
jgi:two-component system, sensor histidine kinase PdtaS